MTEDKTVKGILHGVPVTVTINGKPEYTPTTEEVRYKYSWWTDKNLVARGVEPTDTKAEFDRWLAEVKAQAWQEGWDTKPPYQEINNPYRQGEGSENSNSQPTAETSNLLNKQDAK